MYQENNLEPVDYLVIGHLATVDSPQGPMPGGQAVYAALTARAMGLKVGVVTAWGPDLPQAPLRSLHIAGMPTERSTTLTIETDEQRARLQLQHLAPKLDFYLIPESWRSAPVIHLAPVAQEVEPAIVRRCAPTLLGVTPRGWLRSWDDQGRLAPAEWPEASFVLNQVNAAVVDWADIDQDRRRAAELAAACPLLAVYDPLEGATVFWQGDEQRFEPHRPQPGAHPNASDIFAALFFARLYHAHDPWDAARFATDLSGTTTERLGLQAVPTQAEVHRALSENIYS